MRSRIVLAWAEHPGRVDGQIANTFGMSRPTVTKWRDRFAADRLDGSPHSRHRAIGFKRFLTTIEREVPDDADVRVVLDDASTRRTPAVKRRPAAHPGFVPHFTPTSGSRLTLVERRFAEPTTKKPQRGTHRSVRALNRDIRDRIGTWNDDPRPRCPHQDRRPDPRIHRPLLQPRQRPKTPETERDPSGGVLHRVGAGPYGHFDPSRTRTVDNFRTPPTAERIVTNVGRGSPAGSLRGSAPPRACEPRPRVLPWQALQTRG